MLSYLKSVFKWTSNKTTETKNNRSYLFLICTGILEDVLLWKKWWFTLLFYLCFTAIFVACVYKQLNLLQFVLRLSIVILSVDALESWLIYKHRTTWLKRLTNRNVDKLESLITKTNVWIKNKFNGFLHLRYRNHAKAFLLLQIMLSFTLFIERYINEYILLYILCTLLLLINKLVPQLRKIINRVQQNAESDIELEDLIPDVSDANLELLSFEQEHTAIHDDRQSLDFWKPDDLPLEETSDSSDNSSSLVTNLSIEKIQTLTKNVEDYSDSSEEEYMPQEHTELIHSSLEVQPAATWSNAAYSMFSNIGGAMVNMVYSTKEDKKRKRVSSVGSSDGFEMIDKNEM